MALSGLAANPALPPDLLDDTYDVTRSLAHNPAVPLDLLAAVTRAARVGPTPLPRIAAATRDEVEELARSPIPAVRMLLAERPDLPPAVVARLAEDQDAKVLKSIAPNPFVGEVRLRAMVAGHGARVLARVARNPTCSPELLHELATHVPPAQKAYRAIAAHPHAGAATLVLCLGDARARPVAARHPALPAATIVDLLQDPDEQVAAAAAANPSLPRAAMERLLASTRWVS